MQLAPRMPTGDFAGPLGRANALPSGPSSSHQPSLRALINIASSAVTLYLTDADNSDCSSISWGGHSIFKPIPRYEVYVNGAGPLPAILDTGSSVHLVSRRLLPPHVECKSAGLRTITTAFGSHKAQACTARVTISGPKFRDFNCNLLVLEDESAPSEVLLAASAEASLLFHPGVELRLARRVDEGDPLAPPWPHLCDDSSDPEVLQQLSTLLEENAKVTGVSPVATFRLQFQEAPPVGKLTPPPYRSHPEIASTVLAELEDNVRKG